jgi:phosphoribosylformimino-5-aminoimidazole carboxamide ribotide isomerase
VAFSLDLRTGQPIGLSQVIAERSVTDLALRASRAGVRSVIVLDVGRVGTAAGSDLDVIISIRRTVPGLELFVGGGVRGWDDLVAIADAGCSGALVATALQSGRITASQISAARLLVPGRTPST